MFDDSDPWAWPTAIKFHACGVMIPLLCFGTLTSVLSQKEEGTCPVLTRAVLGGLLIPFRRPSFPSRCIHDPVAMLPVRF